MVTRHPARSLRRGRPVSIAGGVGTALVAGLSMLMLLIALAVGLLMWNSRSGKAVHKVDGVEAPALSPRAAGTSTLSHGGPAPEGMSGPSGSKRAHEPFLEPGYRTPRDSASSREAGGVPARDRSPRGDGTSPGSGGQDP